MGKTLRKILNWILNILILVLLIIVVYMFINRIFGDSPTDFQIISGTFSLVGLLIIKLFTFVYSINREIGELKVGVRNGFNKIKEDMKRIENKIDNLSRRKD